ncbi:hypothetical protein MTX35_24950 [Rhodococcus sp. ARC_M12]|uniref:hypothetical protein n=1 Tax=Rhodococcus sp. ARC_M12 TaxID=2928854 RepID=UPI001FB20999|nr:hypothetical protein [Rhodococcus sp. ARC_M12]MCJ0980953.1 hypothetical protein [Rhodococcus sp. ARC_M12]
MLKEAKLVERFAIYLNGLGHKTSRKRITLPGGGVIVSDVCDLTSSTLYEAKASSSREAIRMALGQILDYGRFVKPKMKLAVLVPERPSGDLVSLLEAHGVGCTYQSGQRSFENL